MIYQRNSLSTRGIITQKYRAPWLFTTPTFNAGGSQSYIPLEPHNVPDLTCCRLLQGCSPFGRTFRVPRSTYGSKPNERPHDTPVEAPHDVRQIHVQSFTSCILVHEIPIMFFTHRPLSLAKVSLPFHVTFNRSGDVQHCRGFLSFQAHSLYSHGKVITGPNDLAKNCWDLWFTCRLAAIKEHAGVLNVLGIIL
jgi:hypothetical protein